jgi:3',5'-cyclic AMP phosphodiesterase CpdA
MRLVHLTDPHLTSLSERQLPVIRGKRRLGYWSWKRNRQFRHRPELLERITAAVLEEEAAQILISGDLTQVGLPEEIAAARGWLESLGPPARVALVPGNHDVYRADSWSAVCAQWGEYLSGAEPDEDRTVRAAGRSPAGFPWQRRLEGPDGGITIIGLCSAYPAPLLLADGRLGRAQLERLNRLLSGASGFRCLVLHHPPLPGMAAWRKALRDAGRLRALMLEHGPELVLHGHLHRNRAAPPLGATRIFATASASSAQAEAAASYRVFDIEPAPTAAPGQGAQRGWSVVMRLKGLADDGRVRLLQESAWEVPVRPAASCR